MVCTEVDDYTDKIFKELSFPPLVVGNQLISHDQINEKLKDGHLKSVVELSKIEELIYGVLENYVVNPTKDITRLHEPIMFIQMRSKTIYGLEHGFGSGSINVIHS